MRHQPESLAAVVPCALPRALPEAQHPVTVIATAGHPARTNGLAVTSAADRLVFKVGTATLASVDRGQDPAASTSPECSYRLTLSGKAWSLEGGDPNGSRSGALDELPTVTGLFSALDLRASRAPSIRVTTYPHAVVTTTFQKLVRAAAVVLALLALLAVGAPRPPRGALRRLLSVVRHGVRAIRAPDIVVGSAVLGWWVLSPAFPDDGWVLVRQSSYESVGGFSNYYNGFGANLPNGYWLEWLQHYLATATSTLVALRVPTVVLLITTWVVCRWILAQVLRRSSDDRAMVVWALAAAFLVGSYAWGMTLRPEPTTALLVTAVMACMTRFLARSSSAPVALAALILPFAVTGHHAGLVALAPLLVAAGPLLRWVRTQHTAALGAAAASAAIFVVLLVLGTDLEHWNENVETTQVTIGTGERWADEINRYARLSDVLYGTPLRRGSVALMALTVLAYLLRRRRREDRMSDFPAACLSVGLLLLVAAPSKWPWHFGALIGVAAVAAATESARLRDEADRARRWEAWPFLALAATGLAGAWASDKRGNPWTTLDLRTRDWIAGFESHVSLRQIAVLAVGLTLLGALLWEARRGERRYERAPWRAASWAAPALAAPLVVFTVAVLVADARATSAWTLTRQNVDALRGRADCGLADDMLAAVRNDRSTLVMPDLVMYLPCAQHARLADGVAEPPDHLVTSELWSGWNGIGYPSSPFAGIFDLYDVEEIPLGDAARPPGGIGVSLFRVARELPGVALAPATHVLLRGSGPP